MEAARRDPAALTSIYRRYVAPVYRYLYKWVGNPANSEDLTSQVFIDVLESLVDYQERGHFADLVVHHCAPESHCRLQTPALLS